MKQKLFIALIALAVISFFIYRQMHSQEVARVHEATQKISQIEAFTLTDEKGASFSEQDLFQNMWVMNFFFTRCQGPCPMMSQKMARLQKEFSGLPHIKLASITMDPSHDQPDELAAYGEKFNAIDGKWKFLTGDIKAIIHIARDMFKLPAGEDPEMHSSRFVLVDVNGIIRGYYDSSVPQDMKKLIHHVQMLTKHPQT